MKLTEHDLRQIDEQYIATLAMEPLRSLTFKLLRHLKEAMEQLNQNSTNSSLPPRQDLPWAKKEDRADEDEQDSLNIALEEKNTQDNHGDPDEPKMPEVSSSNNENEPSPPKKKPGKQLGAEGVGRKVSLPVTQSCDHVPTTCVACNAKLDEHNPSVTTTGLYVLDIESSEQTPLGIQVSHTKHLYYEVECDCGHKTNTPPGRCSPEAGWSVSLTEWHLCGPMLISLIVCLSKRFHLSRRRIQEFMNDWLGLYLSVGVINQCIHEAGRAVAPLEEEFIKEIQKSDLLHIDETSWKQLSTKLWLWVFATSTLCLFLVGPRTKAVASQILSKFSGWIMTDGYQAYRHYGKRLRCWAHLIRKLKGLSESLEQEAQSFGQQGLALFKTLKDAVYAAREGPEKDILAQFKSILEQFRTLCLNHWNSEHAKTQALAREFIHDWDAIWCVLSNVNFPLTNNEAERLLRHWVIDRYITFGTRTTQGSQVFSILASVIETCRLRKTSPWKYLAQVIFERRKNNPAPPLPITVNA